MKKLIGRGRLPKLKNVNRLTPEQLRTVLSRFGIDAETIRNEMLREFARPAGRLSQALRMGMPDQGLLNQLHGQIKRIRATLERRMVRKAIGDFRLERMRLEMKQQGVKDPERRRMWIWIGVADGKMCVSCIRRHRVVKSLIEWQKLGVPKSPQLVCDGNCRCSLFATEKLEKYWHQIPAKAEGLRRQMRTPQEAEKLWNETQQIKKQTLVDLRKLKK